MSTSKHWLEDGAPEDFERLLRAARGEKPPAGDVERALLAAGIVGATSLASGTAAGAVGGAAGKALLGGATHWLAIGVISAGAVVATVKVVEHRRTDPVTQPAQSVSVDRGRRAVGADGNGPAQGAPELGAPVVAAPPVGLPEPIATTERAPSARGSTEVTERGAPSLAPSNGDPDRTLTEEMALIDAARSSLRAGDAGRALRSASEYNRRFAAGRFAPEALFLLMQARMKLGQSQAAADVAREIIRRFPNGAQVGRAREVLEAEEARKNP